MDAEGISRRELLRVGGMAGAWYWLAGGRSAAQDLVPATIALDHLLLGVPNLEEGIAWVEEMTGVEAERGGSNPGQGTHNALLSLGGSQYLEIIAPDPAPDSASGPEQAEYKPVSFLNDLRTFREPRLFAWAVETEDIAVMAENFVRLAQPVIGPSESSRTRPDGTVLQWRTLLVPNRFARLAAEPIPFWIQWAPGSAHPSENSPKGCELEAFAIEHPDPAGVTNALQSLGMKADVTRASTARLRAMLGTPRGTVELS